ncbi:MAG: hypothetical protein N0E48_01235 [Candidatus Thiodiazotropha endolucinida]|nr:hypothetical protein [Candidatus Thiodiazotropha taylori]MCW4341993.1 hypothetical protein [Candidatus Thiodiazotropha endolucinida]
MDNWFFELVLIIVACGVVWAVVVKLIWFLISVAEAVTTKTYAFLRDKADQKNDHFRSEIEAIKHEIEAIKHEIEAIKQDKEEKLAELTKELQALEESVGIEGIDLGSIHEASYPVKGIVKIASVEEGSIGILGWDQFDPFEEIGNDNDVLRRKVRYEYFSIKNIEKRKKLIELRREVDKLNWELHQVRCKGRIREEEQCLEYIKNMDFELQNKPMLKGCFLLSIPLCFLGYWLFVSEVVGMLAGLAAGFILSLFNRMYKHQYLINVLLESTNCLLERKEELLCMQALQKVGTFSSEEELNGERLRRIDGVTHGRACQVLQRKRLERYSRGWTEIVLPVVGLLHF